MADRWATFDCYGTLIDWNGGIRATLARLWPDADADELLERYHEIEPRVELDGALPYREVLTQSLRLLAEAEGLELAPEDEPALAESLPTWRRVPRGSGRARGAARARLAARDPLEHRSGLPGCVARQIGVPGGRDDDRRRRGLLQAGARALGAVLRARRTPIPTRHVHVARERVPRPRRRAPSSASRRSGSTGWARRASDPRAAELTDLERPGGHARRARSAGSLGACRGCAPAVPTAGRSPPSRSAPEYECHSCGSTFARRARPRAARLGHGRRGDGGGRAACRSRIPEVAVVEEETLARAEPRARGRAARAAARPRRLLLRPRRRGRGARGAPRAARARLVRRARRPEHAGELAERQRTGGCRCGCCSTPGRSRPRTSRSSAPANLDPPEEEFIAAAGLHPAPTRSSGARGRRRRLRRARPRRARPGGRRRAVHARAGRADRRGGERLTLGRIAARQRRSRAPA